MLKYRNIQSLVTIRLTRVGPLTSDSVRTLHATPFH